MRHINVKHTNPDLRYFKRKSVVWWPLATGLCDVSSAIVKSSWLIYISLSAIAAG